MAILIDPEVEERVARLELPFNRYGLDQYGVSRKHLAQFFSLLAWMYRNYFRVRSHHIERVPDRGRVMLIGNHSGGLPVDGGMVLASLMLDHEPPRLGHGMVEKFAQRWPLVSTWFSRVGQFTGLPEVAARLLRDDRVLMVFPEGARGTGKLYKDRYKLLRFGTGFMRLALQTRTPIVPLAFIGGEEALPMVYRIEFLGKLIGAPYWPVPRHIVPVPMPVQCEIVYGEPMHFEGNGSEDDDVIIGYVDEVKAAIVKLIDEGLELRGQRPPDRFGPGGAA